MSDMTTIATKLADLKLTGQEPDMGLWASVEQGIAALKGAVGSAASSS